MTSESYCGYLFYACSVGHEWQSPTVDIRIKPSECCPHPDCDLIESFEPHHAEIEKTFILDELGNLVDANGTVLLPRNPGQAQLITNAIVRLPDGSHYQLKPDEGMVVDSLNVDTIGTIVKLDRGSTVWGKPIVVGTAAATQVEVDRVKEIIKAQVDGSFIGDLKDYKSSMREAVEKLMRALPPIDRKYAALVEPLSEEELTSGNELTVDVWLFHPVPIRQTPYSIRDLAYAARTDELPEYLNSKEAHFVSILYSAGHKAEQGIGILLHENVTGYTVTLLANMGIAEWYKQHPNNRSAPEYWNFLLNVVMSDTRIQKGLLGALAKESAWVVNEVLRLFERTHKRKPHLVTIETPYYIQIHID